jgi:hypothetical protein
VHSTSRDPGPGWTRYVGPIRFVASAAAVAYAIRSVTLGHLPAAALFIGLGIAVAVVPEFLERRRRRAIYRSGNMRQILETAFLESSDDSENSVPLKRALALSALGVTGPARLALQSRRRRPLSDEEREELLIIEALLEAFDGEHTNANRRVAALDLLPMPTGGAERRSRVVRESVAAIVRAFDGRAESNDLEVLVRGPEVLPVLYWVTRYAAAAVCAQRGARDAVHTLLAGAPAWPEESALAPLHRDLLGDDQAGDSHAAPARRVA